MTQLRCAHHFLQRVWIGLGEKNLEFDKHEINLRDEDGASYQPIWQYRSEGRGCIERAQSRTCACCIRSAAIFIDE